MPTLVKPRTIPSYRSSWARSATESAFPGLWVGKVGHWVPALGPTGVTLRDVSGRGNHGTLTTMAPATDWVVNSHGPALDFDGGDDHVSVGNLRDFGSRMATHKPSVVCWLKTTSTASEWILGVRDSAANTRLDCRINTSADGTNTTGHIQGFMLDEDNAQLTFGVNVDTGITDGNLHLVAVTWDGPNNTGQIYVDGISQAITYDMQAAPNNFINFVRAMYLAGFDDGGAPLSPLTGQLNSLTLYDRIVAESEIRTLYTIPYADLIPKSRVLAKAPAVALTIPEMMAAATLDAPPEPAPIPAMVGY